MTRQPYCECPRYTSVSSFDRLMHQRITSKQESRINLSLDKNKYLEKNRFTSGWKLLTYCQIHLHYKITQLSHNVLKYMQKRFVKFANDVLLNLRMLLCSILKCCFILFANKVTTTPTHKFPSPPDTLTYHDIECRRDCFRLQSPFFSLHTSHSVFFLIVFTSDYIMGS